MKKLILIVITVLLTINSFSQAPSWSWAQSAGGIYGDFGYKVVTDLNGYTYVAGSFGSTIIFGSYTLTNPSIFLVKYDTLGNVIWAKDFIVTGNASVNGLSTDLVGNIYITGNYTGSSITFGGFTLTNTNAVIDDVFTAKCDAFGNVVWAKGAGGMYQDIGKDIIADSLGNVFVTGVFNSPLITFDGFSLADTNTSYSNIFILKYDPSGNVVWVSGGESSNGWSNAISLDGAGNIYVSGSFSRAFSTFGSFTLSNSNVNYFDFFILKCDSLGNVLWAKNAIGNSYGQDMKTDKMGNSYVAGMLSQPLVTFGGITISNTGNHNVFIVKYDTFGNVIWAERAGGTGYDNGTDLSICNDTSIYVAGFFSSPSITFGSYILPNPTTTFSDVFIAKYDSTGTVIWAKNLEQNDDEKFLSIASYTNGDVYLVGSFEGSINVGSTILTNNGNSEYFIAKLSDITTGINNFSANEIVIYPNPSSNNITINFTSSSKNISVKIYDTTGRLIKNIANLKSGESSITISELENGLYLINVGDGKTFVTKRFIKQ